MTDARIPRLGPKHRALAQYIVAHPTARRRQIAEAFGVSESWVSYVTNSDAFQNYLRQMDAEIESDVIIPLRAKLVEVADKAIDRLAEKVPVVQDPRTLLEIADKTLHRLGYAPSRGPEPVAAATVKATTNVFVADANLLAAAREKMVAAALPSGRTEGSLELAESVGVAHPRAGELQLPKEVE